MGYAALEPIPMRGLLMTLPPIETGEKQFGIVD
jgi:hypothetical protein